MRLWCVSLLLVISFTAVSRDVAAKTWTVNPGQSIQAKIEGAAPGDTIQILPGVYNESITIAKDGLILIGLEYEGEYAVLNGKNEGGGLLETAVRVKAKNIRLENLHIENYSKGGITATSADGLHINGGRIARSGESAITVKNSRSVHIERCIVRDATQAGISIENAQEIRLVSLEVYSNRVGLVIADCLNVSIFDISVHHNSIGIILGAEKPEGDEGTNADHLSITHSRIVGNGLKKDEIKIPTGLDVIPVIVGGVGIHIFGYDHVEIAHCYIESNGTYGIMVGRSPGDDGKILASHTYIHHNRYDTNGTRPVEDFKDVYPEIPPGDIYWDGTGERNQFQETGELKTWPENLIVEQGGVHTEVIHFL